MEHQELIQYAEKLTEINRLLKMALRDMHPIARRYADNNPWHLAKIFNNHTKILLELGIKIMPNSSDGTIWARDPDGREFDGLTDEQAKQGNVSFCPINHEISYWKKKYLELAEKHTDMGDSSDPICDMI
jgi:hypothetical protein